MPKYKVLIANWVSMAKKGQVIESKIGHCRNECDFLNECLGYCRGYCILAAVKNKWISPLSSDQIKILEAITEIKEA